MNLYKVNQEENCGWDTFDSAVVVAESEEQAKKVNVGCGSSWLDDENKDINPYANWATKTYNVKAELIGIYTGALPAGSVIISSFNAG